MIKAVNHGTHCQQSVNKISVLWCLIHNHVVSDIFRKSDAVQFVRHTRSNTPKISSMKNADSVYYTC